MPEKTFCTRSIPSHEWGTVVGCDCVEESVEEFEARYGSLKAGRAKIALDPNDPFESVLIDIVAMNRKKRADYANDSDIFSNFRDTASMLGMPGFSERESALFLILVKIARIKSLRANGRMDNPSNESVADTVLDLAVYSVIYLALSKEFERVGRGQTSSWADPDMDDDPNNG